MGRREKEIGTLLLWAGSVLAVSLGLAGCSGSDADSSADGAGGEAGDTGSGGTATGGTSASGGGSGGTDSTNTGGTAALLPQDLYPLEVGATWTFEVTEPVGQTCTPNYESIERTEAIGGRDAFVVGHACTSGTEYYLSVQDGELQQWIGDAWVTILPAPIEQGREWSVTPELSFRWIFVGPITVPAGTYGNCWGREALPPSAPSHTIYCPDVGPVRRVTSERTVELTSLVVE